MKKIAAAFVFFTRLPLWRLKAFNLPLEYFKPVINYWSIVGWLTAGVMAFTLWASAHFFPFSIAVLLAILSRVLLTGALHEDGLADFFDGFGGGTTRSRTLEIMKDSHIGTYGVISLVFYFALLFYALQTNYFACLVILAGDPFCKWLASQLPLFLPYARNEEESKSKVVYTKPSIYAFSLSLLFGVLPLFFLPEMKYLIALVFPVIVFFIFVYFLKKRIGGYTGDCCGALFLLCELAFYLGVIGMNGI